METNNLPSTHRSRGKFRIRPAVAIGLAGVLLCLFLFNKYRGIPLNPVKTSTAEIEQQTTPLAGRPTDEATPSTKTEDQNKKPPVSKVPATQTPTFYSARLILPSEFEQIDGITAKEEQVTVLLNGTFLKQVQLPTLGKTYTFGILQRGDTIWCQPAHFLENNQKISLQCTY